MKYQIIYTDQYNRRATKFFKKHQNLLNAYRKTLQLLEVNPQHPSLRLHSLQGKLLGVYSVSINKKYRLTIEFLIKDGKIIPIDIGSHDEVY